MIDIDEQCPNCESRAIVIGTDCRHGYCRSCKARWSMDTGEIIVRYTCVDCEREFDGPEIPDQIAEVREALMCPDCAKKETRRFPFRMAFDPDTLKKKLANPKQKE